MKRSFGIVCFMVSMLAFSPVLSTEEDLNEVMQMAQNLQKDFEDLREKMDKQKEFLSEVKNRISGDSSARVQEDFERIEKKVRRLDERIKTLKIRDALKELARTVKKFRTKIRNIHKELSAF